jgi:hypothetical protein
MMKKKNWTGKKHVLNANTRTNLLALIKQICKWLNDSAGLLPAEITLQVSPTDFVTTAAGLADEQLVAHARTLRGEARRIESTLSKLTADGTVVRIANNVKSLLYGLDDLLRTLQ